MMITSLPRLRFRQFLLLKLVVFVIGTHIYNQFLKILTESDRNCLECRGPLFFLEKIYEIEKNGLPLFVAEESDHIPLVKYQIYE
jgi:hypothetical protein